METTSLEHKEMIRQMRIDTMINLAMAFIVLTALVINIAKHSK